MSVNTFCCETTTACSENSCYKTVPSVDVMRCDAEQKSKPAAAGPQVTGKRANFILLAIFTTSLTMLFIVYLNFPHLDE
jgi:hypothetical protein